MPDDQISQSVDNLIAEGPDDQSSLPPPAPSSNGFSLGSNPSSNSSTDNTSTSTDATDPVSTAPVSDPTTVDSSPSDDLNQIKQQALSQLTPIISELDQTPEEKYRTLMMLIQASDDKGLIKEAFEAASNIEDKKAKAEALLNIVNEINYFSSSHSEKPNE